MSDLPYNAYGLFLKQRYGEKVYKIPVKLDLTCPNRDGNLGYGGCIFCNEGGGSHETMDSSIPIKEQIRVTKQKISTKYNAKKFIPYFQSYTNTYMDDELFKMAILSAIDDDIVGIDISTRPDCVDEDKLIFLQEKVQMQGIDVTIELGLQTVNYKTLKRLNRGHGLAEFIESVCRIKKHGFKICVHMILGLPWDDEIDVIESAKILSALDIDEVKIHSLYIPKNTRLAEMYLGNEITLVTLEDYIRYVILFLRYLNPSIVVQRLVGRIPADESIFCNWGVSWWKIRDTIVSIMKENDFIQGDLSTFIDTK